MMSPCTACCVALILGLTLSGGDKDPPKLLHTEDVLSLEHDVSLSITIDQGRDIVELNLIGPADVYYAVGFGSTEMQDTWAIVVNGEDEDGWFEQTLSDHSAGIQSAVKSFEMLQNSLSAQTNDVSVRRVHLRRSLSSLQHEMESIPFDATQDSIDIIWAVGNDNEFTHHIESGTKTLLYDIKDTMTPHLPSDVWLYDGTVNVSAMVVIVGMGALFVGLAFFYGWKWYQSRRQISKEMEKETDALLSHQHYDQHHDSQRGDRQFIAL